MMLFLFVLGTFVVMLGLIWFQEGWKKALKIIGLFLASFVAASIIEVLFGVPPKSETTTVIGVLIWGTWAVGLLLYNLIKGYIINI
jgi:hypothetical protein